MTGCFFLLTKLMLIFYFRLILIMRCYREFKGWNLFFLDFSLTDWIETNGYSLLAELPFYAASQLLHDLDIIQYLGESSCNRKSVPFYPSKLGWNNGNFYISFCLFSLILISTLI